MSYPLSAGYILRAATVDDIPQIHQLMTEMATFEKLLDTFQATEQTLLDNIFTQPTAVNCLVICHQSAPETLVSYIMWFHNYSSFRAKRGLYLEDIYIAPKHRRLGLGQQVLQYLARKALELNCARFEWVVLDWNQSAIEFYEHLGASVLPDWRIVRIEGGALENLAQAS